MSKMRGSQVLKQGKMSNNSLVVLEASSKGIITRFSQMFCLPVSIMGSWTRPWKVCFQFPTSGTIFFWEELDAIVELWSFSRKLWKFCFGSETIKETRVFRNLGVKIGLICAQTVKKFRRTGVFVEDVSRSLGWREAHWSNRKVFYNCGLGVFYALGLIR
jgi:hypothetical protein